MTLSAGEPARQPLSDDVQHRLTLYVSAGSDLSRHAVVDAKAFCECVVPGDYELQVLDLETHASRATAHGVMATPTLVATHPLPARRHVGDLSDIEQVARALGLVRQSRRGDARSGD